jgi:hypothetical protein
MWILLELDDDDEDDEIQIGRSWKKKLSLLTKWSLRCEVDSVGNN